MFSIGDLCAAIQGARRFRSVPLSTLAALLASLCPPIQSIVSSACSCASTLPLPPLLRLPNSTSHQGRTPRRPRFFLPTQQPGLNDNATPQIESPGRQAHARRRRATRSPSAPATRISRTKHLNSSSHSFQPPPPRTSIPHWRKPPHWLDRRHDHIHLTTTTSGSVNTATTLPPPAILARIDSPFHRRHHHRQHLPPQSQQGYRHPHQPHPPLLAVLPPPELTLPHLLRSQI